MTSSVPVTVAGRGVRLVGELWEPQGPAHGTVLLLHGGAQRRHSWRATGERLASQGWRALAFDSRGHGDSDWAPDGDYSASALVDDVEAIVATLNEKPVLIGASMGGMASLMAEGERGGLARALVLVDVVARIEPEGVTRIHQFMHGRPEGFASLEEAADAIAAYNPHRPRPKSLEGLRKNLHQRDDGRWYWHWDPAFLQLSSEPEREIRYDRAQAAARNITVPTLLIRGGHSDIVSEEGLREMQQLIPHAETVEVPATGHMIAGDDNDVFTARLGEFLSRV